MTSAAALWAALLVAVGGPIAEMCGWLIWLFAERLKARNYPARHFADALQPAAR